MSWYGVSTIVGIFGDPFPSRCLQEISKQICAHVYICTGSYISSAGKDQFSLKLLLQEKNLTEMEK